MENPSSRRPNRHLSLALSFALALAVVGACTPTGLGPTPSPTADQPSTSPGPTATATERPTATASPKATPTPACQLEVGSLDKVTYPSQLQPEEVPVWIYKPPCYDVSAGALPVLYLLHGKPYDEQHWVSLGLVEAYEAGLRRGDWGEALLVLPRQPEPLFSRSDGGPGSYEEEFVEGLVPFVESSYRCSTRPRDRRLAGISRGGVWALEIGLRHPDQFGTVVALSPSLAVNYPRPAYDPFELAARSDLPARMLLLAGAEDWARPETERLADLLATGDTVLEVSTVPGDHSDPTWTEAMPAVLQFLLAGVDA